MTIKELIREKFGSEYTVINGKAMNNDVDNGYEIKRYANEKLITIYPYILFTDGHYHPMYFDSDYSVTIEL